MAIYRFNVRDGVRIDVLAVGEHATVSDARREALIILLRLIEVTTGAESDDWTVDVTDEAGVSLFCVTLNFSNAAD